LGAVVALKDNWAKKHLAVALGLFAILGLLGMGTAAEQAVKSALDSSNLNNAVTNLGTSTKEIGRMTDLNTKLQEKLVWQSQVIENLAQKNMASSARIEKSTQSIVATVRATHKEVQAVLVLASNKRTQSSFSEAWINATSKVAATLRDFGSEWASAVHNLELAKWETTHYSMQGPKFTEEQRQAESRGFDDRIDNVNKKYAALLATTIHDAEGLRTALLPQIPRGDQTLEDAKQAGFLTQFETQLPSSCESPRCCDGLPELADYLDTLARRAKAASS
jgi:hypothetical protein